MAKERCAECAHRKNVKTINGTRRNDCKKYPCPGSMNDGRKLWYTDSARPDNCDYYRRGDPGDDDDLPLPRPVPAGIMVAEESHTIVSGAVIESKSTSDGRGVPVEKNLDPKKFRVYEP